MRCLQAGTVDGLHVDGELTTVIADDQDADAATTGLEGLGETGPEVGLVDDWEGLLDITSLGHGNNRSVLEVKNTVLLEDRTEHGLDDNTWAWVGDERGLLMQLLGEEVNAQVSVLAGGRGGGDADDLARTTLKDQEIAEADVVAWDGDGVGCVCWLGDGSWQRSSAGATSSIFVVVTHLV